MNQVVQYIFFFLIGTTILNFLIALGARAKTGNREFNLLILYWGSLFATYGGVAALSATPTQIAFAYFTQWMPSFLMTKMLRDSRGIPTNWRRFGALQILGSVISAVLILRTDAGFTLSLIPITITTTLPYWSPIWNVLVKERRSANWIEKGMGIMFVSGVINHFNYAFFRLDESAAWWGWSVSIAQYQCLSIFLPLLINHRRERKERLNLEIALEKLSGKHPETSSTAIDDLYRILELQIGQKEAYSRELARTNRHLEEERDMNEILIKTISHDLANPLTVVTAYLDMIQTRRIPDEDLGKIRDRMQMNLRSAMEMISRVRKTVVSRNEADLLQLGAVDLGFALRRVEMNFEERLIEKRLRLRIMGDTDVLVSADENALVDHVFSNIVSNAIKFSYEGSDILISCRNIGSEVEVEFRDFGIGIQSTRPDKRIARSTIGTKGETGTGFGLIVTGYYLQKFGADLEVVPHTGDNERGTSFIVRLRKEGDFSRLPTETANNFS